jgi:hypothetical protein
MSRFAGVQKARAVELTSLLLLIVLACGSCANQDSQLISAPGPAYETIFEGFSQPNRPGTMVDSLRVTYPNQFLSWWSEPYNLTFFRTIKIEYEATTHTTFGASVSWGFYRSPNILPYFIDDLREGTYRYTQTFHDFQIVRPDSVCLLIVLSMVPNREGDYFTVRKAKVSGVRR